MNSLPNISRKHKMNDNNALSQAVAQAESIVAMVAALNVDYDRLEVLRCHEEDSRCDGFEMLPPEKEELATLEAAAGECKSREDAERAIQQDPLSVEVREDWHTVGAPPEGATEFQILLCTGGPAARIMGTLDALEQPVRAWIEYQDWGTPWTTLTSGEAGMDWDKMNSDLIEYCQQFYFGE